MVRRSRSFTNMSTVNRRLQSGRWGVKGALRAAIDESSINSTFDELSDMVITPKEVPEPGPATKGSVYGGSRLPDQSSVLAVLGNILTTRDGTTRSGPTGLTNRGCGAVAGVVRAVVQRGSITWTRWTARRPVKEINMKSGRWRDGLSAVNKAFGRSSASSPSAGCLEECNKREEFSSSRPAPLPIPRGQLFLCSGEIGKRRKGIVFTAGFFERSHLNLYCQEKGTLL